MLAGLCTSILKRKLRREDGHDSVEDAKAGFRVGPFILS